MSETTSISTNPQGAVGASNPDRNMMNAETKVKSGATLASALVKALSEIEGVTKDKSNPHFKSKYVDLSGVLDAVRPVFARHDLAVTQETALCENGVIVETVVLHSSGDERRFGQLHVPANKQDAQGFGSALTYAKRYSLMTAFGVPAEDDDGNAAVKAGPHGVDATVAPITDAQRDLIATLAPAAGKSLQEICDAYKVDSIKELTAKQAEGTIKRLHVTAREPV